MKKTFSFIIIANLLLISCGDNNFKKKPKNIILMIGDGMGLSHIQAALTKNKGDLVFLNFPVCGIQKTYSADDYITDSGAAGTAMATGSKTNNKTVGLDSNGLVLKSILEYAEENGLSTGLVATSAITHATPACFIAHQPNRYKEEEIAADFLKTDIDVFIGGGLKHFNQRKDSIDLTKKLKNKGYTVLTDIKDIENYSGNKLAGFTAKGKNPKMSEGRGNMLLISAMKAIEILSKNRKGFFLMVEGSQIDWGGHDNDAEYIVDELLDFNKTITAVNDFAEKNGETLVIVTADHETGGMVVLKGNYKTGEVQSTFTTTDHTGTMVPVFANGPGAQLFTGVYENTDIFEKMKELFRF